MPVIDISRTAADVYFGPKTHVRSEAWGSLKPDQKDAALAHAARVVSRELGEDVATEEDDPDDYFMPSYAVFEQALAMMLRTGVVPNEERTGPHYLAVGDEGGEQAKEEDVADPYGLCSEAAGYLQRPRRQLRIERG